MTTFTLRISRVFLEFVQHLGRRHAVEVQHRQGAGPPTVSREQAHAGDIDIMLAQQRAQVADDARAGPCSSSNSTTPTGTISVGWLNSRTMRGLSGEPKKVPPAESTFSPL